MGRVPCRSTGYEVKREVPAYAEGNTLYCTSRFISQRGDQQCESGGSGDRAARRAHEFAGLEGGHAVHRGTYRPTFARRGLQNPLALASVSG